MKSYDLKTSWFSYFGKQEIFHRDTFIGLSHNCNLFFDRLYNKEAVLEFLIDRSKFECASSFEHLKGLKV